VVVGLLEKAVFDALTHQARAEPGIWTLLALMVALEVSAYLLNVVRWLTDARLRFGAIALLRKNMLLHVLRQPGRGSRADRSSGRPPPACSCGTPSCW
jgi:ATP-binding cassette subfamily B protein